MNNRSVSYLIFFFMVSIMVFTLCIFRYDKIDSKVLNKNWYRYNYVNGYYDVFNISEYKMSYYKPTNENYTNQYDSCGRYRYNKKNKTIVLDCKKKIVIKDVNDDVLTLNIDGKDHVFYTNINDSLNYEFNKFYGKSMSEYKKSESNIIDLIKLPIRNLSNVIRSNDSSKLIFMGSKCSSVDCLASYDVIEKWLTVSNSTYYINSDEISSNIALYLNKLNPEFSSDPLYYNDTYPRVIITSDSKIIDTYLIKCDGFNCKTYYNK